MTTVLVVDDSAVDRRLVSELLAERTDWSVGCVSGGEEAMARIEAGLPDIVITDMQMPGMNGLDLVRAIHTHHGELPVVLITAHGSESLAIEALAAGAASYVPKSHLAVKLVDVVSEILALARAEQHAEEMFGWLGGADFELENNPALIEPLVDLVQQMLVGMGFGDFAERLRISVALKEALLNAIYHGNLELSPELAEEARDRLARGKPCEQLDARRKESPYANRKIHVTAKVTPEEVRMVVRDDGTGFDVATVPVAGDPAAIDPKTGRGLPLIHNLMDEVRYNGSGNKITLIKRRPDAAATD